MINSEKSKPNRRKSDQKKIKKEPVAKPTKEKVEKATVVDEIKSDIENIIPDNDSFELDEKVIIDPYLSKPTVERDYSKAQGQVVNNINIPEIEEPVITPPTIDFSKESEDKDIFSMPEDDGKKETDSDSGDGILGGSRGSEESGRSSRFDFGSTEMPGMSEADKKTKKTSAEYLADTVLAAYEQLNELGKNFVSFDEKKMQARAINGKFDFEVLSIELPMTEDGSIKKTVYEILQDMNGAAEETFVVNDEFKEKARPLLVHIFMKKGWGMTPEQQLLALLAQDMAPKIQQIVFIKTSINQMLKISMEILAEKREANNRARNQAGHTQPPNSEDIETGSPSSSDDGNVTQTVEEDNKIQEAILTIDKKKAETVGVKEFSEPEENKK